MPEFDNHIDDKFQDACDAGEKFNRFMDEKGWGLIVEYVKAHPQDAGEIAYHLYENFPDIMILMDNEFEED